MIQALIDNIEKVIVGKRPVIELAVTALLCRGHILLEDVPGTGKTMMVKALAKSVAVEMKRLQCTPDLLPSDITGAPVYNQKNGTFEFRPGPIFTHFLLADEINRATPRAQSALLECMEEFHISMDGTTYSLPALFMVMATQNPIEMAGTFNLPEAQLDRFLMRLRLGYPSLEQELKILADQDQGHPLEQIFSVLSEADIIMHQQAVKSVFIHPDITHYIAQLAAITRTHTDVRLGISPRGTLALAKAAKGLAYVKNQSFVTPDSVKHLVGAVWEHRLIVRPQSIGSGKTATIILEDILNQVQPPV